MSYRVTPELVPGPTLVWPERWVPGPDTFTSKLALPNGIYVKQHPDGRVHLVARLQAGRITEFLTLYGKDMLGYFDEGGSAQTYYSDGRMENFQARGTDDDTAYGATVTFKAWVKNALKSITRPLPEGPDALADPGLAIRCRKYFARGPYEPNPMLNHALLDVLRTIAFLTHWKPLSQGRLYTELVNRTGMPEEWARMLAHTLPMIARCLPKKIKHPLIDPGVYWEPVWTGPLHWQSTPVLEHPLVEQFMAFQKDFGAREIVRKLLLCADPLVVLHPSPEPISPEEALERARELMGENPEPLALALQSREVAFLET